MINMSDVVKFKDFSLSPEPVTFKISPDEFLCYPEIPLDVIMEVAALAQSDATGMERFKQTLELFEGILEPESYETFRRRCRKGTKEDPNPFPVGMRHIRDLLPWVMEVYGLRPTQESSESADGSEDESTSLTATASATD
jgi:hypothetical protein